MGRSPWSLSTDPAARPRLRLSPVSELLEALPERRSRYLHVSSSKAASVEAHAHPNPGPFELTKLSAQISTLMANRNMSSMDDPVLKSSYEQKGTFRTAQNIVRNHGFRGLYAGFRLHLLRDAIGTTIYFATYESTKQMLVKLQKSDSPTSPLSVAVAGGMCGLVSWACVSTRHPIAQLPQFEPYC